VVLERHQVESLFGRDDRRRTGAGVAVPVGRSRDPTGRRDEPLGQGGSDLQPEPHRCVLPLDLASAGFFDAALGNDWGCAGCIAVALLVKEGIVVSASAACVYFLNVAALACNYFLPIILDFVFVYTPFNDVRNTMCGGGLIDEIDYC